MLPQWFINHWAETLAEVHRYPHEKLRYSHGCGEVKRVSRKRGVPIGIDNPNFSVINRSLVHRTWCTKSLRASDVIGIYWPENWDALSPLELHVPSFLIFLPCFLPAPPVSAKPPFYIHSLYLLSYFFTTRLLFFLTARHVVRPSESICLFHGDICIQSVGESTRYPFNYEHTRGKFKESVTISYYTLNWYKCRLFNAENIKDLI